MVYVRKISITSSCYSNASSETTANMYIKLTILFHIAIIVEQESWPGGPNTPPPPGVEKFPQ